jgi:hypothetical protein
MKKTLLITTLFAVALFSCKDDEAPTEPDPKKDTTEACDTINAVYTGDIDTIILANCGNGYCHGGGLSPNLISYDSLKSAVNNNGLLTAISHEAGRSPMPKNGSKLDDKIIQRIKCWVEKGMVKE